METRLSKVFNKIENSHAFSFKKWNDKMWDCYYKVAEHISKLLLWSNDNENKAQWCESIAKQLQPFINSKVLQDKKPPRKLTQKELKEHIFDGKMYDPTEFQETLENWISILGRKNHMYIEDEPDYHELWERYCKVRDELLHILTKVKGDDDVIKKQIQDTCEHFTLWNYANTY